MGLFKLRQELAVDLGTANTIIMKDGKIVFDEPSVIAFDRRNDEDVYKRQRTVCASVRKPAETTL